MSDARPDLSRRAADLREAFDGGFAQERRPDLTVMQSLLAFSLGGEPYAMRLTEISSVVSGRPITPVPDAGAALLGFAGFRGTIVPVYDLHVLLGRPPCETPRWLAMAAAAPVVLAFETFDGHLRVATDSVMPREGGEQADRLVREVVADGHRVRSVVHLPSIIELIVKT
jgi:chemotaxis signal transduction protein